MNQVPLQFATGLDLQSVIGVFVPILIGVANVVPSLLNLYYVADKRGELEKDKFSRDKQMSYDFIVVGGGVAGSLVANRLSHSHRVLLIERGGEPNPLTSVPGLQTNFLAAPETDYSYLTVPQTNSCFAMKNRRSLWSRGKMLGGSSGINGLTFVRGHPYDYDIWSHTTRDKRWSYYDLIPYFLRPENYNFDLDPKNSPTKRKFHHTGGELDLTKATTAFNLVDEFLDAMQWAGTPRADLNGPFLKGCDSITYTQRFGRRVNGNDAFLAPIRNRKTLRVVKFARVFKVLLDKKKVAYGVEYEQFGKVFQAGARKEIILSAGAIETPKLLMLSGIGPKDHLKDLGIPVIVNSPLIGKNLQDHVGTFTGPIIINKSLSYLPSRYYNIPTTNEFLRNGTGFFSLAFAQAIGLLTSNLVELQDYPDIQVGLSTFGVSEGTAETWSRIFNVQEDLITEYLNPVVNLDSFNLIIYACRPKSRGEITLRSKNYLDDPLIDPNYFSSIDDINVVVDGLKQAIYLAENAPSLKRLGARLSPVPFPTCKHLKFRSDPYLECLAREFSLTSYHFSGTVRMGWSQQDSALDSELRVRGAKRLRVIDASVMPFVTSMNTMAPTYLIAERGVAFVIDFWNSYKEV